MPEISLLPELTNPSPLDQLPVNDVSGTVTTKRVTLANLLAVAYPVGYIYESTDSTDPATLFGFGTWQPFGAGRVVVGLDAGDTDFDTPAETGGSKTVTLTVAQMPSHSHTETNNSATTGPLAGWGARDASTSTQVATGYTTEATGGGEPHPNMPPYIVAYRWRRTA